jgi:cytochrome c peroxidase
MHGHNAFIQSSNELGLGGNGRACATCHDPDDNFQLTPAKAAARYAADPNDPLFNPIDADDFVANGTSAHDFSTLTQAGLIRIRFNLPANFRLVDDTTGLVTDETFVDIWRSVPTVVGVGQTGNDGYTPAWNRGPNTQGGYQLDARVDNLQDQALGAFTNHAQITNFDPTTHSNILDALKAFQESLPVHEADPITPGSIEDTGRAVFQKSCANCHNGEGGSNPVVQTPAIVHYHDITTACPPPTGPAWHFPACAPAIQKNARTYEITFNTPSGPVKQRRRTTDPGRAILTGFVFSAPPPVPPATCAAPPCGPPPLDDWQKMDIPSLRGVSKTAPYFSNNKAATLDDVVTHYEEFYKRVNFINSPTAPTPAILTTGTSMCGGQFCRDRILNPADHAALVAYLKTL